MANEKVSIEDVLLDLRCKGELELYVISLGGLEFICRPLSYQQYNTAHQVLQTIGELDAHELIIKISALYPDRKTILDWIEKSGPNADKLANDIISKSSFGSKEEMVDLYDASKKDCDTDFMAAIQIYISKSLGISPLELEKLSLKRIMELLVRAEHVTEVPMNVRAILGFEEKEEGTQIQLPIAPGMESTDLSMTKEFMLDPKNASAVPPEVFDK